MCGRFALYTPPVRLARFFEATLAEGVDPGGRPSWNVAPTRGVLALRAAGERDEGAPATPEHGTPEVPRILDRFRWGLVPSWSKSPDAGSRLFNARGETVDVKPSFRAAFKTRRAAVPADGFYEWRKGPGRRKQPYYFTRADGEPMAFAGLWEIWRDPARRDDPGAWIRSCTIITTSAGPDMDAIHDRMPVVLEREDLDEWLDPEAPDRSALLGLLRPTRRGTLVHHAVDPQVGNVRNDGPGLIEARPEGRRQPDDDGPATPVAPPAVTEPGEQDTWS